MLVPPPFSFQRLGATRSSINPVTATTGIVTTGQNINGVVIRTLLLESNTAQIWIEIGGIAYFKARSGAPLFQYQGPGIYIPPGLSVSWGGNGAAAGDNFGVISLDTL